MGINKIIEGGLGIIKSAGRTAHEQEAAIRAAQNAKVAEQMANLPPRNKKANEALGLYHPVGGGIKLSKPVSGMHATTVPDPKFKPPKIGTVTPEQMVKEEAAIIPLVGDRAAAGRYLTHVGENELETPVRLTGGARYMDANYNPVTPDESAAWESGAGRISALAAQAGRAGEGGRPVYGMYVAGSGTNTDFNVMGANALLQQIPFGKITKKAEKAFDQAMREGSKAFPPIPEWPGIRSPLAQEMILDKSNGIMRTKLFGTMGKEEFQSMGFPDVPGTRKAIVEPELLDVPTNQAGFRMARMDTSGRIIEDPIIPSDYPKAWAGQVAGKFDEPTDYKDIWQTHHEARRLMGDKAPASGDYYSFSRAHPIQYADQEWLDKLMQQRFANERKIKTGEYKEGGEVDMPNDVDLTESDKKLHALIDGHRFKHSMKSGGKVESKIEGDDPDAKLHALIEARRKEVRMASGGQAFKTAMKAGATEAKPIGFDKGGAAFGFFPHLKAKRSKQDPEAAKNVPIDVARGVVSGVLGAPGDIESLLRIPYDYLRSPTMSELVTGEKKSKTFAPTSEDIEKKLPFKSDTPVSRAATGAGQLAGGFYYGPGSPLKVIANLPGALKHGATEFAKASAAGAPRVIKPIGGNWIPGEVEDAVKPLKRKTISNQDPALVLEEFNKTYTPKELERMYEGSRQQMMEYKDLLERDVALNQWVDNNLSNYLKKQMGTEKDPIRKLADEGITHYSTEGAMRNAMDTSREQAASNKRLRKKLGMPEEPLAKTDLGRIWEEGIDNLLDQGNMVSPKQLEGGNIYRDNPWLQNLPEDSTLYRLDRPSVDDMNLLHIMDVLREDLTTGRIKPSDLKNFSIDRAVRRTHEYNQELAKAQEGANAKKLEGMTVYKEYPNGFKWVKLEKPGDFAAESNAMGHSVRGYEPPKGHPDWVEGSGDRGTPSYGLGGWEAIKSGKAQVYSLVDPKGNPHATIEAGAVRNPQYEEIRNHFDEAHEEVLKEMTARGMDISDPTKANGLAWKRAEEIAREQGYQFVNQIKGKGNDRPINKYDPYTQDFVTSGDWTEVRDLQNTGLKLVGEAFPRRDDQLGFQQLFPDQKYVTSDEVNAFRTKADQDLIDQYKDWKSKVDFEDPQFKDYEGPEFISNEEYFKRYFPDDPAAQADFIRGGKDSPSMIPPESLGMKDWDTLMNEGVFSYDDVSFLNKVMPQRYLTAEDIAKAKARLEEPPLAEKSGGAINMAPGGFIKNLLKMTPKEEALAKLPQMKAELAAKQALEAEYQKAMRNVPYDKQVTLKDWQASQKKPATKTVWHGSPHHFKPTDKNPLGVFDPTKIGTGEGTQAFGHGHYLAEAKGNAEGYRHMLSVDPSQGSENIKFATLENFMPNEAPAVQKQIKDFLDGTGNYADFVRVIKQQGSDDFKQALISEEPEMFKAGALYQVELPEEKLASMLDYDLPYSQQPESVKKAINVEGLQKFYNSEDLPMSQILHHAHQSMTPPQFAEFLRNKGIPGIKYKDAQSRGIREAEEGTRNIVIFPGNEDLLNIVGKEKRGGLIHTRKQYA